MRTLNRFLDLDSYQLNAMALFYQVFEDFY